MQIKAVYDNGKLQLPGNIRLKHSQIMLVVNIPDSEVEVNETVNIVTDPLLKDKMARLEKKRHWQGPWKGEKADQELLAEGVEMKYGKKGD